MNAMPMSPPTSKRQQQQQSQKMLLNPFGPPSDPSYVEENANDRRGSNRNYSADDNHPVVAFVSGIAALVDDESVKKILDACGKIVVWKRAYDSDERPQSFGFCEFQTMSDAVRAVRVLASAGEAQKGASEFRRLCITVDISVQSDLDTQLSMLELQDDTKDDNPTQVALELVKNIFSELEESIDKKKKDSNVAKTAKEDDRLHGASDDDEEITETKQKDIVDIGFGSGSGSADHKDKAKGATYNPGEHEDGSDAEDSKTPFSVEEEETWEKEKIQQVRYKRYVVGAEEREQRMAKEQAEREDRLERSAMRELDRIEERQRARDSMAELLLNWDDKKEKSSREHEYYRDRERWWRHRKAARARELELDDVDRRREEREMESAKKEKQVLSKPQHTENSTGGVDEESETTTKEGEPQTTEPSDRREKIEALIKEIPTDTNELFAWPLKWNFVDEHVLATKIEPAVTKRLVEYLGSDADDGSVEELAGFIVSHIRDHNTPSSLAEELEMVLVEEASVFVARIWRVIVYESEARARGLI
ncbi:hypothetical protein GGH99_000983 [Coemansia sp. RSA 1285]|nr:hypothetical protein GGH99_000983 [Coemansia sp. RSA 1285]